MDTIKDAVFYRQLCVIALGTTGILAVINFTTVFVWKFKIKIIGIVPVQFNQVHNESCWENNGTKNVREILINVLENCM